MRPLSPQQPNPLILVQIPLTFFLQFSYDDYHGIMVAYLIDSFKQVEILMALEEQFGVSIGEI